MSAVLGILWIPIIGIAAYLLSRGHTPSVAFLAVGVVLLGAHTAMALWQLWWHCCGGSGRFGATTDHPKSALLTPQSGSPHGGGSAASDGAGGHHGSGAAAHTPGAVPAGRNPFYATYGLLPGSSSVFAYQIFIPGGDEEQGAAAAGNYTGLQSGPQRSSRGGERELRDREERESSRAERLTRGTVAQPLVSIPAAELAAARA
ncbi:hypothetical protein GPECTOR_13g836 [Gonium pectorale]|uniref:Uncharacterized protein n=1 Tax=Gonium pectorale TaxID=33097 RepID=A0A150GNI8_GONPE|nr:hypothetical protein GPECTOR_13g836 [Gonium pectorale]|eukprot:KXZ51348.1 hypothetical protein GPECTOR_13g836 [Gonium pectorale]